MLKIESNLKINGRHWGLAFVDGVAYTANVALAAKLLLKGYVVTDQPVAGATNIKQESPQTSPLSATVDIDHFVSQPDQPVAGPIITKQDPTSTPSSPTQEETKQAIHHPVSIKGNSVSTSDSVASMPTIKATRPKTTQSRKKAVTTDAADKR